MAWPSYSLDALKIYNSFLVLKPIGAAVTLVPCQRGGHSVLSEIYENPLVHSDARSRTDRRNG